MYRKGNIPMTYATRTITHGTEQVTFSGTDGQVVYSTGVTSFAPSTDQDSKQVYADARNHMTLMNAKNITIEVGNYQYNEGEYLQMGYALVNGGYADTGKYPKFDAQRILTVQSEDGSTTQQLEVYYNCTSSDYTESDDEDEDEINPKVYTRTLSVAGRDFEGYGFAKKFIIVRSKENAAVFDTFKTKILTPADFKPTTKP